MPQDRRTTDRRRRILYSSQTADTSKPTAASRRAKEKLREARQPTKVYGARVHRRLRARWFSLVPVKRRTMLIFSSIIAACALLLTYAHFAAVTWPSLVYRPEISRPLRLDHPDSFGRWFISSVLVASAGASLLIYQLRRHRNDDYRGHYRLWRLVIFVLLLASVNSLVMVVDWGGSVLDAAFGKRVAFSGYDWLRIVLGVGGVVLALRLVAEVRRSRWALTAILIACGFLALPEATKWKLFAVEDMNRWALVTSAPLLGYTSLFLAFTGYLRLLYREVRGITDEETIRQKLKSKTANWFTRSAEQSEEEPATRRSKRRKTRPVAEEPEVEEPEIEEEEPVYARDEEQYEQEESQQPEEAQEPAAQDETQPVRKKRRWFGLRAAKPETEEDTQEETPKRKKKRRFGFRLDPNENNQEETETEEVAQEETGDEQEQEDKPKKKRFGLSWRNKKKKTEAAEDQADEPDPVPEPEPVAQEPVAQESAEETINEDEIDWNSMSKSERRRLRKKLKRQNRAA